MDWYFGFCIHWSLFSDGGKLELWDLDTKQTVCSELAHENSITALCVSTTVHVFAQYSGKYS